MADAKSTATLARTDLQKLAGFTACQTAILVDAFHVTWRVIDVIIGALGAPPVFGAPPPVDDRGACAAAGITRTPQGIAATGRAGMMSPLLDRLARLFR